MQNTITKTIDLTQNVDLLLSHVGKENTIKYLDDLFYYFISTLEEDQIDKKEKTLTFFVYKSIKDFLTSLKTNDIGTQSLNIISDDNPYIVNILGISSLIETIKYFNILLLYFTINVDIYSCSNEEKENLIHNYKNIYDFLISLYPYDIDFIDS